jgi:methylmalonyl-CoA mutase
MITCLEAGTLPAKTRDVLLAAAAKAKAPTLGVTGTGGAGKSSLTDEIIRRFRLDQHDRLRIASYRSTRRGASPAARCWATASG